MNRAAVTDVLKSFHREPSTYLDHHCHRLSDIGIQSIMDSPNDPKIALQGVQQATWSFPAPDALTASIRLPNTSLSSNASTLIDDAGAVEPSAISPDNVDSQENQPIIQQIAPSATPVKTPKKARKRKAADPDGDFRSSTKKTKKSARGTPTPTKSKPKRKTYDYYAETDYKPTTKITLETTINDEIDDDGDICNDDCEEKDEQDMIHCDGEACREGGKWFHTQCVGFGKMLPSNIEEFEWYCEICRGELGVGEETDGLIYRADGGVGQGGAKKVSNSCDFL